MNLPLVKTRQAYKQTNYVKEMITEHTQTKHNIDNRIHYCFIPNVFFLKFYFFFLLPPIISLPYLFISPCLPLSRVTTKPFVLYIATIAAVFLRSCPRRRCCNIEDKDRHRCRITPIWSTMVVEDEGCGGEDDRGRTVVGRVVV